MPPSNDKNDIQARSPSTSERGLIWGYSLYRGNQVKLRSVWWALVQEDWSASKKGKFGHRDRMCGHREMTIYKPR